MGGKTSRAVALLLLTLGLVGMHQLAAAAHSAGSTVGIKSVSNVAVVHGHSQGTGDSCAGDATSEVTPSCGETGDVCVATVDDMWVLGEPTADSSVAVGESSVCVQGVTRGTDEWGPPDLARLQVWRS